MFLRSQAVRVLTGCSCSHWLYVFPHSVRVSTFCTCSHRPYAFPLAVRVPTGCTCSHYLYVTMWSQAVHGYVLTDCTCSHRLYVFVCSVCNGAAGELVHRVTVRWVDVVHLALFNLTLHDVKTYFHYDAAVTRWINDNWDLLQAPPKVLALSPATGTCCRQRPRYRRSPQQRGPAAGTAKGTGAHFCSCDLLQAPPKIQARL